MGKPRVVEEKIPYGVYTWHVNGKPVVDQDFNYLVAPARKGDLEAIKKLSDFVHNQLGIHEGGPVFRAGVRPISQDEWEDQKARQLSGEVPDPYDLGNLIDEYNYQKELDSR